MKKKMSRVIFLSVLGVILFAPFCRGETRFAISSGWLEKQTEVRKPIWKEYIEAAQFAAGDDEEAKSVVKFLKTLYIAIPNNPGSYEEPGFWLGTSPSKNGYGLGVLIFTQEDAINISWQEEFKGTTLANFEYPLILVRPYHQSGKLTKGLVMLQQGYQMMAFSHGGEDEISFFLTRVKCLEMLFRAISDKFPKYKEVVKKQAALSDGYPFQFNDSGLRKIYGKAWRSERNFQRFILWWHGIFEKINRESYPDNIRAKIAMFSVFYEDYIETESAMDIEDATQLIMSTLLKEAAK